MLELTLCSMLTILPDYLYRRLVQGKRLGIEITFFSVWYELRWGIVSCLMLTISLITVIFYFHPSTTTATLFFRTVPILPEGVGRVGADLHRVAASADLYAGISRVVRRSVSVPMLKILTSFSESRAVMSCRAG